MLVPNSRQIDLRVDINLGDGMNARRWGWFLLVAVLLVPVLLSAQPVQVWLNQYGTQSHTGYQLIRTSVGNYAHCVRSGYTGDVLYLSDESGEEIWHHTYGESGNYDSNEDVLEMPDGGFLLAGYAWVDAQSAYDARLIRTDASGAVIWSTFAGAVDGTDKGHKVVRTDGGRIFMTGQIWTGSVSEGALWEFSDNGELLNTYSYNAGTSSVGFHTIILTSDDHLVMSGGGYFNLDDYDGWAIKVNMDGEIVWSNVLYHDYWQYMSRIGEAADGSFIFAGNGVPELDGSPHPWYGRLDANGNAQYTTYYGNPTASSYLLECTPDVDGNWLLAGRYEGADPDQDALLLKIDPADGSVIWTLQVGESDPGSDEGFSDIVLDPDGSYILGGDGDFNEITHPASLRCTT